MIGLVDVDSKIPNLALMKLSAYFKQNGEQVRLYSSPGCYRKRISNMGEIRKLAEIVGKECNEIYASSIFSRSAPALKILSETCGEKIRIGGTGSATPGMQLEEQIERQKPDYALYSPEDIAVRMNGIGTKEHKLAKATEIVNAGHGFTSRGCIRSCPFCMVPKCEGKFRQVAEIADLLNPKSNVLVLHDNNLTADPDCIDKLYEIRDRKLIVDINQGCDVRLMTDEVAFALSEVRHLRSLHYAWDLMGFEKQVLDGIKTLSQYIKPYKHMCFMLVGFNTTYEQDMYRMRKLVELGVDPFVMVYNENERGDVRLQHFARWVNSRIYKKCSFEEYEPWLKTQPTYQQLSLQL